MQPRLDTRAQGSTLHRLPQAFIDKKGEAIVIKTLDERLCQGLIDMYLAYEPRNSFQGLPPVIDEACRKWVQHIIGNGVNLVAVALGGGVVGHVALFDMDNQRCELLVVVAPQSQNSGIGTQLTRHAVQLAYEIGFDRVWLPVEATNVRARHVYKKCGFEYLRRRDVRELEMAVNLKRYHDVTSAGVDKIMNPDVISIDAGQSCRAAVEIFLSRRVATLPVVEDGGILVGILSETDLMLPSNLDQQVSDILTRNVITVRRECMIAKVIRMFQSKKVRSIPVVDDDRRLVGIIGRRDVLKYYVENLPEQASDLPDGP
jgi:CBS domain-containing protein/RimJ/RimL family protein N-acetyltransferase